MFNLKNNEASKLSQPTKVKRKKKRPTCYKMAKRKYQ